MVLGHRPANGTNHGLESSDNRPFGASAGFPLREAATTRLIAWLDLGGDNQLLFAATIDPERRTDAGRNAGWLCSTVNSISCG